AQIERDPINLIIKQPNPSDPFFPATADPKVPYESKVILAGYFASTEDNYYQHDKIVRGHTMDITLLPGMRFVRRFTGDGRWNIRNKDLDMEYKLGYVDPRVGPRDFLTDTTYANGELLYQPDLTTHSEEYPAGVWQEANILRTDRGLQPAEGGKESWSVFRIRLPYAIVGWPTSFTGPANPVGAAAISVVLHRGSHAVRQGIGISVDAGASWRTIWTNDATGTVEQAFDFSQLVVGRYEYLVRIELTASNPAESRLERLAINTAFQVAPRVLPALREAENRMIFRLGTQTESTEIIPNLSNADSFLRHVVSYNGVWLTDSSIMSRLGRQGEVVFELAPPKPGTVHRFSVNAGCRREPAQRHPDDDIKIYYAENEPRDWKLLYDDEYPSWAGHWGYFAYGDAVCRPDTKRVFVRFAITTGSSAAIRHIVMRLHWRPEGAGGMPPRGVKVEHGWTEGGIPKMYSHVCTRPVEKYTVKVGTAVENSYVLLEPVRASGLVWRPNDPPVHKPPTPTNEVVDVAMRDEMRSLLRAIDKDPVSALPIAAKSKIEWLAGAAKQALEMIQKFGWK
ncbi:MAG: hypothetical protein N2255_04785, partial [Kiritimatiellae bacterium]|nr:hypothetical protein [Kiritimatiellia bacterium]